MTTALAFGTFDGLHAGHLYLITEAKKLADNLVIVVARDETVEKVKGKKPLHTEEERAAVLEHLRNVDEAKIGNRGDKFDIVREVNPDIIVLGYDQEAFIDVLHAGLDAHNMNTKIVRLDAYAADRLKSGKLRDQYQGKSPL